MRRHYNNSLNISVHYRKCLSVNGVQTPFSVAWKPLPNAHKPSCQQTLYEKLRKSGHIGLGVIWKFIVST